MKKVLSIAILLSISSIVLAGTEYYVDENGYTQERWVDDNDSSGNDGNNGWNKADEDGDRGVIGKAYDTIMDNSGGAYDNNGNFGGFYNR